MLCSGGQRQGLTVAQHELVVAVKHRPQLSDETEPHDVRAMDAQELRSLEPRNEACQRFANQMHLAGHVDLDVVAGRCDAIDVAHGEKICAICIAHENLLYG